MKRFLATFELTVPEQRVVIVLLILLVTFVALKSRRREKEHAPIQAVSPAALDDQRSASPGTGP